MVSVRFCGEYAMTGTWSITSIVMVVVFTPPELLTVMVNVVLFISTFGLPEISPVKPSIFIPLGKSGLIEKLWKTPEELIV